TDIDSDQLVRMWMQRHCFQKSFGGANLRRYRAMFYIAFGLTSLSFIGHGIIRHGLETQTERMSLKWMGWMASVNLVGAMIYAARVSHR
ncbi:MAG: hypothetical protein EOO38_25070, partial [Cytophagaceae bacterium]